MNRHPLAPGLALLALLGGELAACAGSSQPSTTVVAVPRGDASVLGVDLLGAQEGTGEVACEYQGDPGLRYGTNLELRFDARNEPFALVHTPDRVTLQIPAGPGRLGARLEVQARGVQLAGRIQAGSLSLHPVRPFRVGGVVLPKGDAALVWVAGRPRRLRFTLGLTKDLRWVGAAPVEERPCGDLGLSEGSFSRDEALPAQALKGSFQLRGGDWVPLSATPGGPPRVELDLTREEYLSVRVAELREKVALLQVERQYHWLSGWVPRSWVVQVNRLTGQHWTRVPRVRTGSTQYGMRCPRALTLWAEQGGRSQPVGSISSGVAIRLMGSSAPDPQVTFPEAPVGAASGAALRVEASQLTDCTYGYR